MTFSAVFLATNMWPRLCALRLRVHVFACMCVPVCMCVLGVGLAQMRPNIRHSRVFRGAEGQPHRPHRHMYPP